MFKLFNLIALIVMISLSCVSIASTPSVPCYYLDGSWKSNVIITECSDSGGFFLKADRDNALKNKASSNR